MNANSKKKLIGITVATAAAIAFATAPISSAMAAGKGSSYVKCQGANACKGKSACATASSKCKGHNSCKGKGWTKTKTKAACRKMGGKPVRK